MTAKPFSLSVKAVILDAQGRCLLVRRSPHNRAFVGKWEWPGGKVDPGENFADAVLRATLEETSLTVEIVRFAGAIQFEMPAVNVVQLFMEARLVRGEIKLSEEHDDFAWAPLPQLANWPMPDQLRAFMLEYAAQKGNTHAQHTDPRGSPTPN